MGDTISIVGITFTLLIVYPHNTDGIPHSPIVLNILHSTVSIPHSTEGIPHSTDGIPSVLNILPSTDGIPTVLSPLKCTDNIPSSLQTSSKVLHKLQSIEHHLEHYCMEAPQQS